MPTQNYVPFVTDFPRPKPRSVPRGGVPRAGLTGGIYQDPGVIGQTIGDFRPPPSEIAPGVPFAPIHDDPGWTTDPTSTDPSTNIGTDVGKARRNILEDPEYIQGLQNLRDALFSGQTKTRNALRQAIIAGGFDPRAGATSLGFDTGGWSNYIDPADYAAALANPNSARAQLEAQRQSSMRDLTANLAARNMIRSGASATGTNRIQNAYAQQQNQQLAGLLQALQGGVSSEADYERQQQQDWLTRQGSIAQRLGLSDWSPV